MEAIAMIGAVMVGAGLFGGYAAFLAEERKPVANDTLPEPPRRLRFLILGIVASCCVPLFLSLVQSGLMSQMQGGALAAMIEAYLIFLGLCLVAAFSSRAFLDTISQRVLQQAKEAEREAHRAVAKAEDAQNSVLELADERAADPVDAASPEMLAAAESADHPQPSLSDREIDVLRALTTMTFRTATGLAIDTGTPRNQIGEVLDALAAKRLAALTYSPNTKGVRWKITPAGIAAVNALR